jgi:hypothetical protein
MNIVEAFMTSQVLTKKVAINTLSITRKLRPLNVLLCR